MKGRIVSYLFLGILATCSVEATTINSSSGSEVGVAILGSSYDSVKEKFVGAECIDGTMIQTGKPTGNFDLQQSISESDASKLLGFEFGGRYRYGVVNASAEASFFKNSKSSSLSVNSIWRSEYVLPTKKLTKPVLSTVGKMVRSNDKRWNETCGNEYVDEIKLGAQLFFSVNITFTSTEQAEEFKAKFSVSGPMFGVEASLATASRQFSRNSTITIRAIQIGGDVSKITALLPQNASGASTYVQCTLGDFVKCSKFMAKALDYATNISNGFPSQIGLTANSGGAVLEYHTTKYTAAGLYPREPKELDQVNKLARTRLQNIFDFQFRRAVLADSILSISDLGSFRKPIETERQKIDRNIKQALDSARICYETPLECQNSVTDMRLEDLNDAAFKLPPIAKASFRVWTNSSGVWDRKKSVNFMNTPQLRGSFDQNTFIKRFFALPKEIRDHCSAVSKLLSPMERNVGYNVFVNCPAPSLQLLSRDGTAATVLQIEGQNLVSADIYFGNHKVTADTENLIKTDYPEKQGGNTYMLVLDSTRMNQGWRDINLDQIRETLWSDKYPEADGVFFLVVKDRFGRNTRFDIEYQKWKREKTTNTDNSEPSNSVRTTLVKRNRWWDPNSSGTTVAGAGSWSLEENLDFEDTSK